MSSALKGKTPRQIVPDAVLAEVQAKQVQPPPAAQKDGRASRASNVRLPESVWALLEAHLERRPAPLGRNMAIAEAIVQWVAADKERLRQTGATLAP